MPTSSATSGSQSKALLGVAALAVIVAVGALGAVFVLRSSSGDTAALESVAEPAPLRTAGTEPTPNGDRNEEIERASSGAETPSDPAPDPATSTTDPIAAAYEELWMISRAFIGGSDPVGLIATFTDQVGPFPVADDAALASFTLDVDREERDREVRIQYRAAVRYFSQQSVDEVVALYREQLPSIDLAERESQIGSDDDGEFIDIDFGNFSDHPDPLIWWANLSLQVRADDAGTLVRIYYTVTRTEAAVPTGLLAEIEAGLPLADGYASTSVSVSGFAGDPYAEPVSFTVDITATATLDAGTAGEAEELARLADHATTTGHWAVDEQTESGVWLDSTEDDELRTYLTLWLTETETLARYHYS